MSEKEVVHWQEVSVRVEEKEMMWALQFSGGWSEEASHVLGYLNLIGCVWKISSDQSRRWAQMEAKPVKPFISLHESSISSTT